MPRAMITNNMVAWQRIYMVSRRALCSPNGLCSSSSSFCSRIINNNHNNNHKQRKHKRKHTPSHIYSYCAHTPRDFRRSHLHHASITTIRTVCARDLFGTLYHRRRNFFLPFLRSQFYFHFTVVNWSCRIWRLFFYLFNARTRSVARTR